MSTQVDEPVETSSHPLDSLHRLLVELVNRMPWHSEGQQLEMMQLARDSEAAIKGDSIEAEHPPVVPPAPYLPPPVNPLEAAGMSTGVPLDYDKLAAAMVKAQAKFADQQAKQAAAAIEADPSFEPPGAVTVPAPAEAHAAAEAVATDPNARPWQP
jgi:hypothetical protein